MAETTAQNQGRTEIRRDQGAQPTESAQGTRPAEDINSPLVTEHGVTTVEETVVQKLAGIAAREVPGVYAMGNAARRTFDAISERIPGSRTQVSGGVSVEKGEKQTAIDLTIIIEYGAAVVDVAEQIRGNVTRSVEHGTGLEVVEVNITVADVHLPEEDDEDTDSGDERDLV